MQLHVMLFNICIGGSFKKAFLFIAIAAYLRVAS